jgi:hypothetical protein
LPRALYVDQHGIYRPDHEPTDDELLDNRPVETQFGRAMRQLGVRLILARSPQAKGRVERMNATLQDRLVKALRRANISDLAVANRFLEESFLPEFNVQFGQPPTQPEDAHQPLPATTDLAQVVSIQEPRVVNNDWTIQYCNRILQLPRAAAEYVQARQPVMVCEQLDGKVRVFAGERELAWSTALSPPPAPPQRTGPTGSSQGHKPAANHPWRTGYPRPLTTSASALDSSPEPLGAKISGLTPARLRSLP